ncbi:secreted antigen 1 [Babesia caballi]|uniref:Secreted antigen 1 n=1 Tax=Babesia caballi TaxID=5871 RepID=A0AAV4M288_BABCB|nr:secreted antigen 1 [Babesia caballi]
MSVRCRHIKKPDTLRKALDFLGALKHKILTNGSIEKINKVLESSQIGRGVDTVLLFKKVLEHVAELRSYMLVSPNDYGEYNKLHDCEDCCVKYIFNLMPKLQTTLSYLYFHVNDGFIGDDDGQWMTMRCDGKDGDRETNYLYQWLTRTRSAVFERRSDAKLLPGGYNQTGLSGNTADYLMEPLAELVDTIDGSAYIPKLMLRLLPIADFTYESTALALAVIWAFCDGVVSERIGTEVCGAQVSKDDFKRLCESLAQNLTLFAPKSTEFKNAVLASPFRGCIESYDHWTLDSCAYFFDWIAKILPHLVDFLTSMYNECKTWYPSSLQLGTVEGPFPYGFLFGGEWYTTGSWDTASKSLPKAIEKLVDGNSVNGSLVDLLNSFDPSAKTKIEQPRQKTAAAGVSDAFANSPAVSTVNNEGLASGITRSDVTVASGVSDDQRGYNVASGERSETEKAANRGSGDSNGPISSERATQNGVQASPESEALPQRASDSDLSSASNGRDRVAQSAHEDAHSQQIVTHPGSSSGVSHSAQGGGITVDDNSTITIGGATGGAAVLGGGCAALYFLNVGGIKTLITGVP